MSIIFITFHIENNHFDTSHLVNGTPIKKVIRQIDLGIRYQDYFQFDKYIKNTVNEAFKELGFVIESSQE